jgi:hypothetical protein
LTGPTENEKDPRRQKLLESVYFKLAKDLPSYTKYCLRIGDKGGKEVPFIFNRAQRYLHKKIEDQKRRIGKVRVLVLKGRQQGCSTYTAARFYHNAVFKKGQNVYILSHESGTTSKLFNIVKKYHENVPDEMRMKVEEDNVKSYKFANKSSYSVGTARNKNTGRGGTVQLFHGSECAFYENTDELQTGLLQSIADMGGTEVILESTANGLGNFFHQACMDAMKGLGEYELIFIPWFWQEEYTQEPPGDFVRTDEEYKLVDQFELTDGQLYWRRMKIASFGAGGAWKFQQEYPNTPHEAFISSGESMVPAEKIHNARKKKNELDSEQPMILGVDPSRVTDRFVIVPRRGRKMYEPVTINPKEYGEITTDTGARFVIDAIHKYNPFKVFIDVTKDWGVYDLLVTLGYGSTAVPVVFSEGATRNDLYLNKRAEMLIEVRDWFDAYEVDIPDRDDVHSDIASIPRPRQTAGSKWFIESKENIKKQLGLSTDIMDGLALTFAFPVRYNKNNQNQNQNFKKADSFKKKGSTLSTYNRIAGITKTQKIQRY